MDDYLWIIQLVKRKTSIGDLIEKQQGSFWEIPSSLDNSYPILKRTDAMVADGDCISFCQGKIIGHNAGSCPQKIANGKGIGIVLI